MTRETVDGMEVVNNTDMTLKEIRKLPQVGLCKNYWRELWVTLFRAADGEVISVSRCWDDHMMVISREKDEHHRETLAAWLETHTYKKGTGYY